MMPISRLFLVCAAVAVVMTTFPACTKRPARVFKTEKKKPSVSVDARFEAARQMLIEGKFAEAAAAFAEIDAEPDIRQPLHNWVSILHGLALLFDGREPEARKIFAELAQRPPFSEKDEDAPQVKFFTEVSKNMSSEAVVPASVAKDYDKWTFEGIVFLLYGAKDWNLEKFDEAVPLFRQFADVTPEKMVAWADGPPDLKKLQKIAEGFANDYLEYQPAHEALAAAATTEQESAAVAKATEARSRMKLTTKLSRELDAKIAEVGPKVAAIMAEKEKMSDDEIAFDAKELPAAIAKRADLHSKFLFAEARQAILDPPFKTGKALEAQQLLAKKSQWLANFKDQLLEDINAKGYTKPLMSRQGQPIAGGVAKADAQQVFINSPRGLVPVPWAEISPDTAFEMGLSYISPDMPPTITSFRKWHLGVFGSFAGRKESLPLLKEAAAIRPIFAEELPLFENPSDPW